MNIKTSRIAVFLLVALSFTALGDGTNSLQWLERENTQLREENRKLREELVQEKCLPVPQTQNVATNVSADATFWITSGSQKRHNSACKYYKQSKGYPTNEKIGTPCKICGG